MNKSQILYIFGGLPASGKTTLAKHLASTLSAAFIRIDSIEEAILKHGNLVGPEGYEAAYTVAAENLENGVSVVVDSVNPIEITRSAWRKVALDKDVPFHEIEVVCSDKEEHKKRLEERNKTDVSLRKLSWEEIETREYEIWDSATVFDTAGEKLSESQEKLIRELS